VINNECADVSSIEYRVSSLKNSSIEFKHPSIESYSPSDTFHDRFDLL